MATTAPRDNELTIRGVALGVVITLAFTAANLSLGLKVGLTFATSIPAAVISMALLRAIGGASVRENNIVQTVASAAGTLSSIGFVLPGLVIMGWWPRFPYWTTFWVCATGGLLGVMFSIPLRRALVTGSDLPFPEGVAAAEVLKVGSSESGDPEEARKGLWALVWGSIGSAFYGLLVAVKLFGAEIAGFTRIGTAATGLGMSFSLALIGAGHLVGLSVGLAFAVGIVIAWGFATPILTADHATGGLAAQAAQQVWSQEVKFIGAGVIAATALWSLARLVLPIARGLAEAAAASRARKAGGGASLPIEEQDMPIGWVAAITLAVFVPIAWLIWSFAEGGPIASLALPITLGGIVYVLVIGIFVAAVCGYMAGLIGASNSPVSGLGILAVVGGAFLLLALVAPHVGADARNQLVALSLFGAAIVFSAATISNDNLQDLKTGQLVGATPWKQQVALMIGVVAGAAVIPPVLDLLRTANGFGDVGPHPLLAPQATLMTALAKGVLANDLNWWLIGSGMLTGVVLIGLDALLGRAGWVRVPPLAVGIGIYLPSGLTTPIVLGAVLGHLYDAKFRGEGQRRLGVLAASGLIVGESLFTVVNAIVIQATGNGEPLALFGEGLAPYAPWLGLIGFLGLVAAIYRWTDIQARTLTRS